MGQCDPGALPLNKHHVLMSAERIGSFSSTQTVVPFYFILIYSSVTDGFIFIIYSKSIFLLDKLNFFQAHFNLK